jgi:predicted hotdog family 3-hydroxylacyl-ACP dehydratase
MSPAVGGGGRENRSTRGGFGGGSRDGLRIAAVERSEDGWLAEVEVAEEASWFDGHFPGEPILPAVGQVDLVARLAARIAEREGGLLAGRFLAALDTLRLSSPVRPGDRLAVRLLAPDERGAARFHLARPDGARVSDGTASWAPDDPPPAAAFGGPAATASSAPATVPSAESPPLVDLLSASQDENDPALPDAASLLLHEPPALLAETLLSVTGDAIVCRGRIAADHPAADEGHAGPWMALELAAQAAGLLEAVGVVREGGGMESPQVGYLVRVRNARFAVPRLAAGAPLVARVTREGRGGPLTLYACTVEGAAGEPLAAAHLGTFLPPRG